MFLVNLTNLDESSDQCRCPICNKIYRNYFSLNLHMKYVCSKELAFACPKCPYRSRNKSNYKRHLSNVHQILDP